MEEEQLTLADHLGELRKRVIWIVAVLAVMMVAGFFLAVPAISYLKSIPPAAGLSWNAFSPWDGIRVYMQFALLFSIAVTLPFTLYQLWMFVKPGLRVEEQKAAVKFIPLSLLLFLLGLSFAYFVIFKLALSFTTGLNKSMNLEETYGITQYFSFMFNILVPVSLLFELPVVVIFLTKLRILNPLRLRKLRRYSYLLMVVVSTMIAPPDFISNVLIAVPLVLLYEISVFFSAKIYKKQLEQDRLWEVEYGPK